MAAKPEAPRSSESNGSADSYIGSLISLTSKSEIRYEGLFCNINSQDSTIGLTNVRSFGTEGRKKDGPQVGPSDKVYEYILFRGSDIKDLKVISSPPVQAASTTQVFNDPAIVQTHYPHQAPNSSAGTHTNPQSEHVHPTFQTNLPSYEPVGTLRQWGGQPSSLPATNSNTVTPPVYYPGYYRSENRFQPQQQQQQPLLTPPPPNLTMPSPMMQQTQPSTVNPFLSISSPSQQPPQSLLTPPSGLSVPSDSLIPPSSTGPVGLSQSPSSLLPIPTFQLSSNLPSLMQQTMHHSATNVPLPVGASSPGASDLSQSPSALLPIPNFQSYVLPTQSSSHSLGRFNFQSPVHPTQPSAIVSESSTSSVPSQPSPMASLNKPAIQSQVSNKPVAAKTAEPSASSGVASMASITDRAVVVPNLITVGQLLQTGPTTASLEPLQSMSQKDSEALLPLPQTSQPLSESRGPLLPLPSPVEYKPNDNRRHNQPRQNYRGGFQRGRDKMSRPVTDYSEEFDFTAMNERFNKDEVWGDIGKSIKAQEEGNGSQDDDNDDDVGSSKQHVYVKDDFFDLLSCNSIGHDGSQNGRPKFSQQRKKDTETFGFVPRHYRGSGRGGHNGYGRGSYRQGQGSGRAGGGGYHGRGGNGYVGQGRGRGHNFLGRGS